MLADRYRSAQDAAITVPVQTHVIDHVLAMLRTRILYPSDYMLEPIQQPHPDDDSIRVTLTITGKALFDLIIELLAVVEEDDDAHVRRKAGLVCTAAATLFKHDVESIPAFETLIN